MASPHRNSFLRPIIIALLLGASANYALAWLCVEFGDVLPRRHGEMHKEPSAWPHPAPADWPALAATHSIQGKYGFEIREYWVHKYTVRPDQRGEYVMTQSRFGLPFPSLSLGNRFETGRPGVRHRMSVWHEGIRFSDSVDRGLALRPIWPGFLFNSVVYASLVLLAWSGLATMRRRRRRRRGLCEACGYSRSGLAVDAKCPECGR